MGTKSTVVRINRSWVALPVAAPRLAIALARGEAGTRECPVAVRHALGTHGVQAFWRELRR
jgi:hypothetical protein